MLEKQTEIYKALSDPNRLRILKMLQKKSLCVCEITEILQLATSTVSKHLSILRDAGFIVDEKDKKWINYKINPAPESQAVVSSLLSLQLMLEDDRQVIHDRELMKTVNREELCGRI